MSDQGISANHLQQVDTFEPDESRVGIWFDRATGDHSGATGLERLIVLALQAGSILTSPFAHRGYSIGCRAMALSKADVAVRLNNDTVFSMPLADPYWSRLLNRAAIYEEEVERFMRGIADLDYQFVDCGANYGYWSVLASSAQFGGHKAVAIEASPSTFSRLERNARLNADRFRILNAAVSDVSKGVVAIVGKKHESAFTVPVQGYAGGRGIPRFALDSLLDLKLVDPGCPVVINLDVEGVEREAIIGSPRLVPGDSVLICEDHGADRAHTMTRHLKDELKLEVCMLDEAAGRFIQIRDVMVLDRLKRYSYVGYNVFVTASPIWAERLRMLCRE